MKREVRQENPTSGILFNMVLDPLLQAMENRDGIMMGDAKWYMETKSQLKIQGKNIPTLEVGTQLRYLGQFYEDKGARSITHIDLTEKVQRLQKAPLTPWQKLSGPESVFDCNVNTLVYKYECDSEDCDRLVRIFVKMLHLPIMAPDAFLYAPMRKDWKARELGRHPDSGCTEDRHRTFPLGEARQNGKARMGFKESDTDLLVLPTTPQKSGEWVAECNIPGITMDSESSHYVEGDRLLRRSAMQKQGLQDEGDTLSCPATLPAHPAGRIECNDNINQLLQHDIQAKRGEFDEEPRLRAGSNRYILDLVATKERRAYVIETTVGWDHGDSLVRAHNTKRQKYDLPELVECLKAKYSVEDVQFFPCEVGCRGTCLQSNNSIWKVFGLPVALQSNIIHAVLQCGVSIHETLLTRVWRSQSREWPTRRRYLLRHP
ncbi:hypothetical protein PR048_011774 [Dryococelus australis]|uniref:Uncharacterized protein n=1 Tax=Dryococelus australis TaxID=614101 RepID=A0ABQ9HNA5_9NEOP|nr:hypothetical protein PR048_011774 [Dryococelus australis]